MIPVSRQLKPAPRSFEKTFSSKARFRMHVEKIPDPTAKPDSDGGRPMVLVGKLNRKGRRIRARSNQAKQNTNGLPLGVAVHQFNAAVQLKKRLANKKDDLIVGDTRLHAAETVMDAVRANNQARSEYPRPSKLARRLANAR